MENLEKNCA